MKKIVLSLAASTLLCISLQAMQAMKVTYRENYNRDGDKSIELYQETPYETIRLTKYITGPSAGTMFGYASRPSITVHGYFRSIDYQYNQHELVKLWGYLINLHGTQSDNSSEEIPN